MTYVRKDYNPNRKLTREQVRDIRENCLSRNIPARVFADKYNVSRQAVDYVKNGLTYRDLP